MSSRSRNYTENQFEIPAGVSSISYIDSIEIQQQRYFSTDFLRFMYRHCRSTYGPKKVEVKDGRDFLSLWLHQPSWEAIEYLRGQPCKIARAQVALDIIADSKKAAKDLEEYLARTFLPGYRPYDEVKWERGRDNPFGEPTCYFGFTKPCGPGKKAALYADKLSKVVNVPCCHLEVRVDLSRALNAYSLLTPDELLVLDHRKFWKNRLILVETPTASRLGAAWARAFVSHQRVGSRRWPYGGRTEATSRVGTLLLRAAQDKDGETNANDLLYLLRLNRPLGEQKLMPMFRRLDASWLLPPCYNAMWTNAEDYMNQQVSGDTGTPSSLSFPEGEIPY